MKQEQAHLSKSKPFGHYERLEHLATGGMCHVFRARDKTNKRTCAVKVLKEHYRNNPQVRDLFITEADVSLLLNHPNLMTTYDAGEIDGRFYIAMELMEGGTLGQLVERLAARRQSLSHATCLFAISEVLDGLHALHTATSRTSRALGLVHRDITPHNIFLSKDGRVVLGDFGVAQVSLHAELEEEIPGKIGYLSPELIEGDDIDLRSDLFSVGIVLYEFLMGQRLFSGDTDENLMRKIADARVVRPRKIKPDFPKDLEAVLLKALARRPKDRFGSAEEMLYALEPFWSRTGNHRWVLTQFIRATAP